MTQSMRGRSLDPTHNALVAALRQTLTDVRSFETWFRKADEGAGYGQPHLGQADARRAAERIEAVLRDHTHQDDGFCEPCAADLRALPAPAQSDCPGCQWLLHVQGEDRAVIDRYAEALREHGVTSHTLLAKENPDV